MAAVDTSMWQNLARQQQSPMDLFGHLLELKNLAQQNQEGQLALQSKQMDIKAKQQALDEDQKLRTALSTSMDADGNPNWDNFKKNAVKAGVSPRTLNAIDEGRATVVKNLADSRQTDLKNLAQQDDMFRGYTTKIITASPELRPQLYRWAVQDAVNKGILKPGQAPADYPGDQAFEAMHGSLALGSQLAKEADEKRQRDTAAGTAAETARHNVAEEQGQALQRGLTAQAQAETKRHNLQGESQANEVAPLTPDAQAMVSRQYATTGTLPALGMGKAAAGQRAQIINYAAQQYPGMNPGTQAALFGADKHSLQQVQGTLDSITAFENTAKKNLDTFLNTAGKVVDTGSPWLNKPLRSIAGGLGGTDQQAYETARQTVVPEIARILTNPNLSGALSDSARQEVSQLMRPDATFKQIKRAAEILTNDMGNRKQSLQAQRDAIASRLGNNTVITPTGGGMQAAPPGPQQGEISATGPGGHKIVVRGGRWVDAVTGRPMQ